MKLMNMQQSLKVSGGNQAECHNDMVCKLFNFLFGDIRFSNDKAVDDQNLSVLANATKAQAFSNAL